MNNHKDYKFAFAYMVLLLLVFMAIPQFSHAQAKPSKSSLSQELTQTQIDNQKAQTDNRNQGNELKSFLSKIMDNPAVFVTALVTILVTIFRIIPSVTNNRVTQRNHRNAQFYEAQKRFGDPGDTIRSGAAELLAQMSYIKDRVWRWKWYQVIPLYSKPYTYYEAVLAQLLDGVLIEPSDIVLSSIEKYIMRIISINPSHAVRKCCDTNLDAQKNMRCRLANFFAAYRESPGCIPDKLWQDAQYKTGYQEFILRAIADNNRKQFENLISTSPKSSSINSKSDKNKVKRDVLVELERAANYMRMIGRVYAEALHQVQPIKLKGDHTLKGVFLAGLILDGKDFRGACFNEANIQASSLNGVCMNGADLSYALLRSATLLSLDSQKADLQGAKMINVDLRAATLAGVQMQDADLWGAQLQGTHLTSINLQGAKLSRATIDAETKFSNTNWWEADFGSGMGPYGLNTKMLTELYNRYKNDIPTDLNEIHLSARGFIDTKCKEEQVKQASDNTLVN